MIIVRFCFLIFIYLSGLIANANCPLLENDPCSNINVLAAITDKTSTTYTTMTQACTTAQDVQPPKMLLRQIPLNKG